MPSTEPAATSPEIDRHIAEAPEQTRAMLEELRALIRSAAPDAVETISYGIPTFDVNGHHAVHFAGHPEHVGFHPTPDGIDAFAEELGPYVTGKGTVRFAVGEPLPADLIRRVVEHRAEQCRRLRPKRPRPART